MRTTTVIRGEEWISSLPIHVELFEAMGWKAPKYAHLPVIMKIDETTGNTRKLSKRKDNEAAVSYFIEDGYPAEALIMYLMTIANTNFEEWILNNKFEGMQDFTFSFDKMCLDGALFDTGKLNFFAREIIGKMSREEVIERATAYSKEFKPELYELINRNPDFFGDIMYIEKDKENPRKDYEKFGDLIERIGFFYEEKYDALLDSPLPFNERATKENIVEILEALKADLSLKQDEQSWFNNMKEIAVAHGYAGNRQEFKANPEAFKGLVGDVAEILRITLSGRKNSPNLYYVMRILGKKECDRRIDKVVSLLK